MKGGSLRDFSSLAMAEAYSTLQPRSNDMVSTPETPPSPPQPSQKGNVGVMVGCVLAFMFVSLLAISLGYHYRARRHKRMAAERAQRAEAAKKGQRTYTAWLETLGGPPTPVKGELPTFELRNHKDLTHRPCDPPCGLCQHPECLAAGQPAVAWWRLWLPCRLQKPTSSQKSQA